MRFKRQKMNAKSINNAQKNPLYSSSGRVYFYI